LIFLGRVAAEISGAQEFDPSDRGLQTSLVQRHQLSDPSETPLEGGALRGRKKGVIHGEPG